MEFFSLGKCFSILQKRYIGALSLKLAGTPIEKYFVPFHVIARNNGEINQCQLGEELLIDKASMVRIIDTLCESGMIERTANPEDRRVHLLKITDAGEKWVLVIRKYINEINETFLSFLPEEERRKFTENITLMTDSVLDFPVEPQKEF